MCFLRTGCNLLWSCFPSTNWRKYCTCTFHCVVVAYTTHTKQIHTLCIHMHMHTPPPLYTLFIKEVGQDMEKQCHYTAKDLYWCTTARHVSRPFTTSCHLVMSKSSLLTASIPQWSSTWPFLPLWSAPEELLLRAIVRHPFHLA